MPGHKGGDQQVPFGGFDYDDQTQQVTSGHVTIKYGNQQQASAPFAVDPNTHNAHVPADMFGQPTPTNVTEVSFTTDPVFTPNTVNDPHCADPGHFITHASGATRPVGQSTEYENCVDVQQMAPPPG